MTMRITKAVLFMLLLQPIPGGTLASAKQEAQARKGARNSDDYLKKEVRHELMMVPWYSVFDILQYSVNGNDVTLTGAVINPTLKTDAANAVKHIEGIDKVIDQVEVLPPSPTDDQIRAAEYRAIYSQGTLSRYGLGSLQSIHIIVKGGHVTLEGTVDTEADKNAAGIYANGVPDVFSVTNNLVLTREK
jgi:hyperosmotically inducible protein